VFTIVLTAQGIVNMQYNGLSFKILKYATGSLIPIVGGFVSGGLDLLLSSAVLVKNSFGLIVVIYVIFHSVGSGVVILIVSFLLKFIISLAEPLLDNKFVLLINGVCEIFNYLTAVIFICGFAYVLVCFSIINSTALII
jgi:stage III sporulation protein AE